MKLTNVRFRDDAHLMNVCQRIVSQVGRRVDESSPICDARLPDGSRVNVIAPPLAIDGAALTIRKFKKDKLTLQQLVKYDSISPEGAEVLRILGRVRANVLISGGTGSGKTTLLNCLTAFIEKDERVITCEDSAELQLQQPHVVRLETRPPNLEGEGEITMRDLIKNCLRMRPERIIVGEVRGPEAFDLLQAMNTGHDGSMGTLHANSPREALSRLESMITMGGYSLPSRTIREMITSSIDVVVQAARLRDGSRRITHITEVLGMEGDVIVTQDIFLYDILGEDSNGMLMGRHRSTGITKPQFTERARYFNEEANLVEALEKSNIEQRESAEFTELHDRPASSPSWLSSPSAPPALRWCRRLLGVEPGRQAPARRLQGDIQANRRETDAAKQPRRAPQERAAGAQAADRRARQAKKRVPLQDQLFQAGMNIKRGAFIRNSVILGVVVFVAAGSGAGAVLFRRRLRRRRRLSAAQASIWAAAASGNIRTSSSTNCPTPSKPSCAASSPACRSTTRMRVVAKDAKEPVKSEFAARPRPAVVRQVDDRGGQRPARPRAAARGQFLRRRHHRAAAGRRQPLAKRWAIWRACCATARR